MMTLHDQDTRYTEELLDELMNLQDTLDALNIRHGPIKDRVANLRYAVYNLKPLQQKNLKEKIRLRKRIFQEIQGHPELRELDIINHIQNFINYDDLVFVSFQQEVRDLKQALVDIISIYDAIKVEVEKKKIDEEFAVKKNQIKVTLNETEFEEMEKKQFAQLISDFNKAKEDNKYSDKDLNLKRIKLQMIKDQIKNLSITDQDYLEQKFRQLTNEPLFERRD